jgi:hypothetical protein
MFTRALMAVASTASPLYMVALVNMDCRNIVRPRPGRTREPAETVPGRVGFEPAPTSSAAHSAPKQQGEGPKDLSPFALPLSCDGSTQNCNW